MGRAGESYVPKTYINLIDSSNYLIQDFLGRKMLKEAKFYVCMTIYNTYYTLNKPIWLDPMNAQYRYKTEKSFKDYYFKYKELFDRTDPTLRNQIIYGIKSRVLGEGTLLEKFTFDDWLQHIEELE